MNLLRLLAGVLALFSMAPALALPPSMPPPPDLSAIPLLAGRMTTAETNIGNNATASATNAIAIAALGTMSAITRDTQGRITAYTSNGVAYTVTYDGFGPATIAGGGKTTTITRDANGVVTSILSQ